MCFFSFFVLEACKGFPRLHAVFGPCVWEIDGSLQLCVTYAPSNCHPRNLPSGSPYYYYRAHIKRQLVSRIRYLTSPTCSLLGAQQLLGLRVLPHLPSSTLHDNCFCGDGLAPIASAVRQTDMKDLQTAILTMGPSAAAQMLTLRPLLHASTKLGGSRHSPWFVFLYRSTV